LSCTYVTIYGMIFLKFLELFYLIILDVMKMVPKTPLLMWKKPNYAVLLFFL